MSPNWLQGIAAFLVVLAAGLAFAGWQLTRNLQETPPPLVPVKPPPPEVAEAVSGHPVVTAARPLAAGTRLEALDSQSVPPLIAVRYPQPIPDSFADFEALEGRVLSRPLAPGDVLRPHHFALGGPLAAAVPEGKRALAVSIDEVIGGGGYIVPGDRVDVVFFAQASDGERHPLARRLLRDVEVLSFGAELKDAGTASNGEALQRSGRTAVLALDPDQAPKLLLAESAGRLRLAVIGSAEREAALRQAVDAEFDWPALPGLLPVVRPNGDEPEPEPELGPAVQLRELTRLEESVTPASASVPAAPRGAPRQGRQVIQHVGGTVRTVAVP